MAPTTPLIEARGLCKFHGELEVLHEVSLSVRAREIITVVGPNGAGKTTLLKCLLGLEVPSYGDVIRAPGLKIGYVPQRFHLPTTLPLRVRDFLMLYAPLDMHLVETLGLAHLLAQDLHTLSGGELRRVLLLRALLGKPQLLILDEPTSGVDVSGQGALYRLLKQLATELGLAVLMVSHDLYVVMGGTERVICLNHHICCEGTPSEVGSDPSFKSLFGEDLANQLALYHHHHTHAHGLGAEDYPHAHHHGTDCEGHHHG